MLARNTPRIEAWAASGFPAVAHAGGMPGRKNPEPSEPEQTREYRLMQKRSYGDSVVGEQKVEDRGGAGEVARQREDA